MFTDLSAVVKKTWRLIFCSDISYLLNVYEDATRYVRFADRKIKRIKNEQKSISSLSCLISLPLNYFHQVNACVKIYEINFAILFFPLKAHLCRWNITLSDILKPNNNMYSIILLYLLVWNIVNIYTISSSKYFHL